MPLLVNLWKLIPPSFKAGYCPRSIQQLANDIIGGTQLTYLVQQGSFQFNMGSTTPIPELRIFPWLYTPTGQWFTFQFGLWTSPMDPAECEASFRKMWKPANGTGESTLWGLDGGSGNDPAVDVPTPITGATWIVDHDMDGLFPIGVNGTYALGATGGEASHVITQAELPDVQLPLALLAGQADGLDSDDSAVLCNPKSLPNPGSNKVTLDVPLGGSGTAITNLPPYRAIYWIRHSARRFYTLPA